MRYENNLILRIGILAGLFALPTDMFYKILLKPTLFITEKILLKYNPIVTGTKIVIGEYSLNFVPACTATLAYLLLAVLVLTTRDMTLIKGLKVYFVGGTVIFIANIIRVAGLAVLLIEKGYNTFNKVHLFIWDGLSSVFVVLVWIFLVYYFSIKEIPIYSDIKKLIRHLKLSRKQ